MGRYLELAKRTLDLEQGANTAPTQNEALRDLPVTDPYAERMRSALEHLIASDYPPGMILWLNTAHPNLYGELTSLVPDEIHRLWTERAPLSEFELVLARLVSLHKQCCDLCRVAQNKTREFPELFSDTSGL